MRFFRKAKKREGWLAIALQRDGLAAVSMQTAPGIRPQVRQAVFYPGTDHVELLAKAGRELHAHAYRSITVLSSGEYQILSVDAPNVPAAAARRRAVHPGRVCSRTRAARRVTWCIWLTARTWNLLRYSKRLIETNTFKQKGTKEAKRRSTLSKQLRSLSKLL